MSGDHNQYQKPDGKCQRCGEVNPAEIHTCTPKQHWSDCAVHSEPAYPAGECDCGGFQPKQAPVGWIYEDDEGRIIFSQMPHPDPLWEPVYREQK